MLSRLLLIIAIGVGVYLALRWFARTPSHKVAGSLRKGLLYGGIALLVLLALTGRLHWLFAAMGAAIPFIQRGFMLLRALPLVQQVLRMAGISMPGLGGAAAGTGANSGGRVSSINTRFLTMTLDHATGAMDGEVTEGPHQGARLSELSLETLVELLAHYQSEDPQSAAVLETYLDREHGQDWREGTAQAGGGSGGPAPEHGGPLSRKEALDILGLEDGADEQAIREAHRRLMQRLHPDRGGSDWLAARINQAKDVLLPG